MKEITRITVAEITQVALVDNETVDEMEEEMDVKYKDFQGRVADAIRHETDADDVHVSAKLFIREVD